MAVSKSKREKLIGRFCRGCEWYKGGFLGFWQFKLCFPICIRDRKDVAEMKAELRKNEGEVMADVSLDQEQKAFALGISLDNLKQRFYKAEKKKALPGSVKRKKESK